MIESTCLEKIYILIQCNLIGIFGIYIIMAIDYNQKMKQFKEIISLLKSKK